MPKLNVCQDCHRHVYVDEVACPFCGSIAARSFVIAPRADRLARAAGYARAALLVGAVSSCSQSTERTEDAGAQDARVADASAQDARAEDAAVADAGAVDAAVPQDASTPTDGAPDDTDVPIPLYGGAFPDPRTRAVV